GNVFRYEEPQKGRYREFAQVNAEIIGGAPLASDGEALALGIGTMRAIGLKQVKARIGNIGILRGFLPFPPADQAVVLHSLDKRNFPMLDAELGVDRLVMSVEAEKTIEPPRPLDAYVVPIGEGAQRKAIEVLTSLRAAGLAADIDLVGRGPSKNLDYANAIGARYAVLLGEKE